MLLRKIFENTHDLMAISVLSEEFSAKFCFNIFPNSECFAKYDAFCLCIFDICALKA